MMRITKLEAKVNDLEATLRAQTAVLGLVVALPFRSNFADWMLDMFD